NGPHRGGGLQVARRHGAVRRAGDRGFEPREVAGGEDREPGSTGEVQVVSRLRLGSPAKPQAATDYLSFSLITSPPARVIIALSVFSVTLFEINRTEPSAIAAWNPSGDCLPNFGSGLSGSNARSSGLVHSTASPA